MTARERRAVGWSSCWLICLLVGSTLPSEELAPATRLAPAALPAPVPDSEWKPLHEWIEEGLQGELLGAVRERPAWRSLARNKKLAIGVVNLTDPARPEFATVNGATMMYAASLPKIAILLAAYESFEDGTLHETPQVHDDLQAMIRVSSNTAATAMIDRLGFEKIAHVVTDPRYELYDRQQGGGLWVGKRYAKQGRRYPDPLLGLSHAATVTQVCRFYYLLATGRVISDERSAEILADLSDPGLHHKFVSVIEKRAPGAKLYRKSGTWKNWHSDSVLVWGQEWRHYVLVAMVESPEGETILRQLVPVVEGILEPRSVHATRITQATP